MCCFPISHFSRLHEVSALFCPICCSLNVGSDDSAAAQTQRGRKKRTQYYLKKANGKKKKLGKPSYSTIKLTEQQIQNKRPP